MTGTDPEGSTEEIRTLVLGLLDRAEPGIRTLLAGLRERAEQADDHTPAGTWCPACSWCPLCATVGLLRGERPELAAAIVTHADALAAALRAVLTPETPDAAPEPDQPRVQRIDVRPAGGPGT